ncbi:MAG TPA: hypothetical protein PKE62_04200 [Anaerolineales bacterium]|nr:hypothetical protein [Anaerolineales bacterium]
MKTFKNIVLTLSTGYIFFLFSELLFWARKRPGDSLGEWTITWLAYSLMAFVFLLIVSYFKVNNIWALFLAGAVFGWLGEGIVVQTTYESLPLSISFTALAWHALITVWIGWYGIRRSLHASNPFSTLKLSLTIGLCYGLWAIMWWLEPDGGVSSIAEFATFSFVAATLAILAYWLADWSSSESFRPNRWVSVVIVSMFALMFFFVAVPIVPLAIIILPILLGLAYLGLRWNRLTEAKGSMLTGFNNPVSAWKYLSLLGIPAAGVSFYALAASLNLQWQTNWILYLITTPLGFILFGVSMYKLRKRKSIVQLSG